MKPPHMQRKPSRTLRFVELAAQELVRHQPYPPRTVPWMLCVRQIAPGTLFSVMSATIIGLLVVLVYDHMPLYQRPLSYWFGIYVLPLGLLRVLWAEILRPMYGWWYGLRVGRYRTAQILDITCHQRHYGKEYSGHWQILVDQTQYTLPFSFKRLRMGLWIEELDVGDSVHVLLDPRQAKVLAAFGEAKVPLVQPIDMEAGVLLDTLLVQPPAHLPPE